MIGRGPNRGYRLVRFFRHGLATRSGTVPRAVVGTGAGHDTLLPSWPGLSRPSVAKSL